MSRLVMDIAEIKESRQRFRSVKAKVEDIAASLLEFGQLQPVIIDRNNELVDGKHRLEAIRLNGGQEVWVDYQTVDELRAREIELEVNIQREDMTPKERVLAIAEIDRIKRAKDPLWTREDTARVARTERSADVTDAVQLAAMIRLFPEIGESKSIRQMKSWADMKAKTVTRVQDVKDNKIDYEAVESKIILGDSVEVIKRVPSESFHAIITDPPFGLDYDDRKSGSSGSLSSYEDSAISYERLLTMAPELFRVLRPDGWLVWFLGISWYERAKQAFREAGFIVDELPIVWNRSEGKCHTNRPDRYFARGYDLALHCIKGDPQMVQRMKPNVLTIKPVETADREALVERPVELYTELIKRLTVPGETVADFFAGSGSCSAAAASLGRDYFGVELSPERRALAIQKIKAHTPQSK